MDIKKLELKTKLNVVRRKTNKKQIMLFDTKSKTENFINKLKYRSTFTRYNDTPHFIINKNGMIFQIFDSYHYAKMFDTEIDKIQIKIALENLGSLRHDALSGIYSNWRGERIFKKPCVKRYRGEYYWDPYTKEQMDSLDELLNNLTDLHDIPNRRFGNSEVFVMAPDYEGILYKSNFSDIYNDINPSFNFTVDE